MSGYNLITADPPWWYGDAQGHRPDNYHRMRPRELRAMGPAVQELAAEDAALLLWATGPMLLEAIDLCRAWGFRYRTVAFVWCKATIDGEGERNTQGHYTLPSAEYVLLGVRGSPKVHAHPRQVVRMQPGAHSAKPQIFRELFGELFGDVARLELFARGELPPGWDAWGDQAAQPAPRAVEVFNAY